MQKLFLQHTHKIRFLYVLLLLLAAAVAIPDLVLYYGALESKIGIKLTVIEWVLVSIAAAVRIVTRVSLGEGLGKLVLFWVLPAAAGLLFTCRVIEEHTYTNFVYTHLRIYIPTLAAIGFFPLLYTLVLADLKVIRDNWRQALFSGAALLLFSFGYIKEHQYLFFERLDKEDGIIEYLHGGLFLLSSWLAYKSLKLVHTSKIKGLLRVFWMTGLFMSTFVFFLIGLEELSWGQRLLGLKTPDAIMNKNLQGEINLHNIREVFRYVYYAYFAAGAYGMGSWLFEYIPGKFKGIEVKTYLRPFISRWYLSPYFFVIASFAVWRMNAKSRAFDIWEEVAELFLAIGITIMYFRTYKFVISYLKHSKSNKS